MKEIRLHGIGGQGTVKAGELLVNAAVKDGLSGNSIPFFGFERQGAPVSSFVRLDTHKIRPKNQVYHPNCILVMDSTVMQSTDVFEGIQEDTFLVLNTDIKDLESLKLPNDVRHIALINGTAVAMDLIGKPLPNTIILGAFAKLTGWIQEDHLKEVVISQFGLINGKAFDAGYNHSLIFHI